MSDGSICTPEEQALFHSSQGASLVCLTRGESIGLTLVAESGFISLIAVLAVFVLIFRNAWRNGRLIRHPTDIYMLSLFAFDLIMALGKMIYVKWIHEGKVYTGSFCTAQGIVQQLGDTGSALATLAIAVHTFVVVLWGTRSHQYFTAYTVVGLTWLFIGLFIVITVSVNTHGSNFYEAPVGYWCWIGNRYKTEQYVGQYVWVWVTMFVSFITYTPLFFWARGNITISPIHWWKIRIHRGKDINQTIDPDGRKRRSIGMIAYPVVFAVVALPLSVVRWSTGFGSTRRHMPTATFAVEFIYSLSPALNVALILLTRSPLLLPRQASRDRNRLGVAPSVSVTKSKTRYSEVSRPDSMVLGMGARDKPVPLVSLPGESDMEWHLPQDSHDSEDMA